MIVFYFFSPRITRSVVYGPRPRNTLDLYLPRHHLRDVQDPVPVVIYLTGEPIALHRLERPPALQRGLSWKCNLSLSRRGLDHRLQGVGIPVGAPAQPLRRHRVLSGLPQLPAGML